MFKRISYRIALQFMAFVFLLFLINGFFFLAADFGNEQRQSGSRLEQTARQVIERTSIGRDGSISVALPPPLRDRVRIVNVIGNSVYTGGFFEDIPFSGTNGISHIIIDGERHDILTSSIEKGGKLIGYMQVSEMNRLQLGELPLRALLYLLVSGVISALTFGVGLFFARRSLRPAERMVRQLEQFTQDASHELRTPLTTLNSSIDLALRTKKYEEGLLSAKEDVHEVSVLVERLLELARLDAFLLQTQSVDFSALVESVVQKHRHLAAQRHTEIQSTIEPGVTVAGDAALLKQVLANLLSNAIKFSKPEGGTVRVTLTPKRMTVEDTGVGIPKDALPHVFDRFYQAESSRTNDGFGLGLSLVKRIVDLHRWTISVKSIPGSGTVFTVRFSVQQ